MIGEVEVMEGEREKQIVSSVEQLKATRMQYLGLLNPEVGSVSGWSLFLCSNFLLQI